MKTIISPSAPYSNLSYPSGCKELVQADIELEGTNDVLLLAASNDHKEFCNSPIRASRLLVPDV